MLRTIVSFTAVLLFSQASAFSSDGKAGDLADILKTPDREVGDFFPIEDFSKMKDLYGIQHELTDKSKQVMIDIENNGLYTDEQKVLLKNYIYGTDALAYGDSEYSTDKGLGKMLFSTSVCAAKLFSGDFVTEITDNMMKVIEGDPDAGNRYRAGNLIMEGAYNWPFPKREDFEYICGLLLEDRI